MKSWTSSSLTCRIPALHSPPLLPSLHPPPPPLPPLPHLRLGPHGFGKDWVDCRARLGRFPPDPQLPDPVLPRWRRCFSDPARDSFSPPIPLSSLCRGMSSVWEPLTVARCTCNSTCANRPSASRLARSLSDSSLEREAKYSAFSSRVGVPHALEGAAHQYHLLG